jgi:hypothetical protein
MAEPTGLTDIEGQEIDSNWDEVSDDTCTHADCIKVVDNFDNMGLKPKLLHGVYAYGMPPFSALLTPLRF